MERCLNATACELQLAAQEAATARGLPAGRALSVLWLTGAAAVAPAVQCATVAEIRTRRPWVVAGTDFYDGSHVVCDGLESATLNI